MSSSQPIAPDASATAAIGAPADVPLFVDLDGTLIANDIFQESLLASIKRDPRMLYRLPVMFLRGRAAVKQRVAAEITPDVQVLPYRNELRNFLREQRWAGRKIILASASDRRWVEAVAKELGLFDDVLASDGTVNLKGPNKLRAIRDYCEAGGYPQFGYVGDNVGDLPIWREAAEVHLCAPGPALRLAIRGLNKPARVHCPRQGIARAALRAMRPVQWVKNLLLFVPLLLAHQWSDLNKLIACTIGFVAFSACASAVYLLNDLLDIEADRHHPTKRNRAFASGQLPIVYGPLLGTALVAFAGVLSWLTLPPEFIGWLGLYVVVNCLYSFWLKRKLVIDVILLAGMYTLRVVVGGVATEILVSEWLLAFSMFLFTSLAFAKRHSELARLAEEDVGTVRGRGYGIGDLGMIENIGPTAGYMAVLVLALYINSNEMRALYERPLALWLICPLLLYWITRLWFAVKRGELQEDPIVYAIRDRVSRGVGVAIVLLAVIASRF